MLTRVAAVQLPFTYFSTPQEFADLVRPIIETASENGADLIVLPHLASLMLFGMFDFGAGAGDSLETLAARQNVAAKEWLSERAGYVQEFYLHLFQSLAERVEKWLAPGTVLEQDGAFLYLTAFLLNPAGEIVGRQRQMHPSAEKVSWGVSAGDALRVFETEIGDFGFLIGNDAQGAAIGSTLVANGANVLLHPAATKVDAVTQDVGSAIANATGAYLVQANLVGGNYRGRSGIFGPGDSSAGLPVLAKTDVDGEILFADLKLENPGESR